MGVSYKRHAQNCDFWSPCDLYVKVLVDNNEICRTDFQRDQMDVDFFKTCISNKVSKSAKIKFELWDEDVQNDDVLDRWESNIDQAVESGISTKDFEKWSSDLRAKVFWKDEYADSWELI